MILSKIVHVCVAFIILVNGHFIFLLVFPLSVCLVSDGHLLWPLKTHITKYPGSCIQGSLWGLGSLQVLLTFRGSH